MHRKKEDHGGRRRFFGRGTSTRIEKDWKKAPGKGSEGTSDTKDVSSDESSCQKGGDLCNLPNWENPLALGPTPEMEILKPPPTKHTAAPGGSRSARAPKASTPANQGIPVPIPGPETLENMMITFSDSISTIGEDITLCDFGEYEHRPHPETRRTSPGAEHSNISPTRANAKQRLQAYSNQSSSPQTKSPPREKKMYSDHHRQISPVRAAKPAPNDKKLTPEQLQEEEMVRFAMEQSLAESSSTHQTDSKPPSRHTPMPHPPPSRAEYSTPPIRSSSRMSSKIQTDASGAKFIWKKGKGGRYMKVPINELDNFDNYSATGSTYTNPNIAQQRWGTPSVGGSDDGPNIAQQRWGTPTVGGNDESVTGSESESSRLSRMEQKMIEQAMEQSMASLSMETESLRSAQQHASYTQDRREEELIALAKERSLEESVSSNMSASILSTQSMRSAQSLSNTRQGFLHKPQDRPPRDRPGQNFIWKKGPNNRYIKCPIGLEQVNEGEVYAQPQKSLDEMEQDMLQQAMALSLRES